MSAAAEQANASAVVFAYHEIGVHCLEALLELGFDIRLVVTHPDEESENIWFSSVAKLAGQNDIPVIAPADPNSVMVIRQVAACHPQFLFSFYYRKILAQELLNIPRRGAFNLHGSLLPKYRGRVPVNWAIINGEKETGVSLHRMVTRPDAGNLVAQRSVPILLNDTARDVFAKLVCAAEKLILRTVPKMVDGTAREIPQDLSQGSYFGARRPEHGRIDWRLSAREIHNLIRAVAPPYPGAFFDAGDQRIFILGSYYRGLAARSPAARIYWQDGVAWADCRDGRRFLITEFRTDGHLLDQPAFHELFGEILPLTNETPGKA